MSFFSDLTSNPLMQSAFNSAFLPIGHISQPQANNTLINGYFSNFRSSSSGSDSGSDSGSGSGSDVPYSALSALNISSGSGSYDPSYGYGESHLLPNTAHYVAPETVQPLEYLDAPYATHYGMDVSTAYQEALANTAYQRKVKDLKAAGLNPVLGISGSGSASFYGNPAPVVGSSVSGGSYVSSGSGKSTLDLSDSARKLSYWVPSVVGSVVTMVSGKPSIGSAASGLASGLLGAIRNHG